MKTETLAQSRNELKHMMSWVRSLETEKWNVPYAITLNFWKNDICRETAKRDISHFLNTLNSQVYKNAYKKYGKRLRVIGVFEESPSTHYHMMMESPKHLSEVQFETLVETLWGRVSSGQTYIWLDGTGQRIPNFKMEKMYSNGWFDYITKLKTKKSVDDADILNWYLHPVYC